jgi:hypothetical protein
MSTSFADKVQMQNRLFAELSRMFGQEVPLYDKSLLVNRECNKAVCALLGQLHVGFSLSDEQLDKTSGERHGAIRIGKPSEYRLMGRFFAAFAMEPHNFYDMANVGAKSQPIIATAFRSRLNPDHRVFCSLLLTDYFDAATKARIEALLATREVFSDKAKRLLDQNEQQGGLSWDDANALIAEGVNRIFKWTGQARDHQLYKDLCDAGFKIAADIACFESHHLNHLTPNTFCMDLYTAAMKFCMGEMDEATFRRAGVHRAQSASETADRDWLRLHFKQLDRTALETFQPGWFQQTAWRLIAETLTRALAASRSGADQTETFRLQGFHRRAIRRHAGVVATGFLQGADRAGAVPQRRRLGGGRGSHRALRRDRAAFLRHDGQGARTLRSLPGGSGCGAGEKSRPREERFHGL